MTNETEIDTIVIDKVTKFWDLLFCDCCYIGICLLYSPRVWRWSQIICTRRSTKEVFSTCVEVILKVLPSLMTSFSILHVCGGDPNHVCCVYCLKLYSPRVWRWSWRVHYVWSVETVFSTCVEVILRKKLQELQSTSILHVCGGDPYGEEEQVVLEGYSPRVWRWS